MAKDIKTLGGDSEISSGWVRQSVTEDWDGNKTITYRGGLDKFDNAKKAIESKFPTAGDISEKKEPDTGTGEIVVSGANIDESGESGVSDKEVCANPSCTLQGQMVAVPIYQAPYFNFGTDIKVQDLRTVDTLIREEGTLTKAMISGYNKMVQEYAQWLFAGEKSYLYPAYSLSCTIHLTNREGKGASYANNRVLLPSDIVAWDAIWAKNKIPEKFRPPQPVGYVQWLPMAPMIHVSATEVTLTQTFQGAAKFPNYYDGGIWEPPDLDGTTGEKKKSGTNWNLSGGDWKKLTDGSDWDL